MVSNLFFDGVTVQTGNRPRIHVRNFLFELALLFYATNIECYKAGLALVRVT